MTATGQEAKPEANSGSSPAPAAGEANVKTVPLGEHIELRQKHRALEEEIAQIKAQLSKNTTPAPTAPAEVTKPDPVKELTRRFELQDLETELGISRKQAEVVAELRSKTPGLSALEAKLLAAARSPDVFKDADDGYREGVHSAARPGVQIPSPRVDRDELAERIAYIESQRSNSRRENELFNNLMGSIAAEDVGKPGHQLIPIPR